jgi:hypothetical protein
MVRQASEMDDTITPGQTSIELDQQRWARRMTSALVAIGVGLVSAIGVSWMTDLPTGFAGIPIAGVLGWGLATRLDGRMSDATAPVLLMALGCAVLGGYGVALVATTDLGPALIWGTFGVVVLGLPAFILLLAPATLWAAITSWFIRRTDAPR